MYVVYFLVSEDASVKDKMLSEKKIMSDVKVQADFSNNKEGKFLQCFHNI